MNELKAIEKTNDELRVKNYIVLFDGRDLEGLGSHRKNKDGSVGEYFDPDVDVESSYTKAGTLHIDWEHGKDKDNIGNNPDVVLGYVDWKTAQRDENGIIVERVLNRRTKYMQWLEMLIDEGLVGTSSMPTREGVEKKDDGGIIKWPLFRDSLTVNPMEPRMMSENVLQAYKSLQLIPSEAAVPDKDDKETAGKTANNQSSAGDSAKDNDMEEKELKAMLDENNEQNKKALETAFEEQTSALIPVVEEKATEAAKEAAKAAVEEVLDGLPEVKALMNGETLEVTEAEEDKEFKSVGANLVAIANHTKGRGTHPRMRGLAAKEMSVAEANGDEKAAELAYKAILGSNETIPSQGAFLLEPTVTREMIKPIHEAGIFSTKVRRLPVGPNSNSGWIPGVDETSRATGSRWGGVRGYHLAEAASMTASQPKFRRINWELHKTAVLQYVTDELLNDVGMLTAIVNQSSAEELNFMVNDDILNGDGVGKPLGVLNQACLISPARYATTQVNHDDIVNMWQRLHPRNRANAAWFINSEVEPQLDKLAFQSNIGTTELMSPYVNYTPEGVMKIKGKPVYVTEFSAALGTAGDILLADFGEYLYWEKGAIEAAMSIHVQFLTDQTAFRFISRYDGTATLSSAITPYKGTNTQSPFVVLSASTS